MLFISLFGFRYMWRTIVCVFARTSRSVRVCVCIFIMRCEERIEWCVADVICDLSAHNDINQTSAAIGNRQSSILHRKGHKGNKKKTSKIPIQSKSKHSNWLFFYILDLISHSWNKSLFSLYFPPLLGLVKFHKTEKRLYLIL